MTNFERFIVERTQNQTEKSAQVYRNFYNRLQTYFPEDKPPEQHTKEDFIHIFSNMNTKSVGNFTVIKSYIRNYIEWMVQQGNMTGQQLEDFLSISYGDIDHSNPFLLYYFKNFNELYSSLKQTIECHLGDNEDDGEFDTLRCAIYLSWFGFTLEEICNIFKSDISPVEPIVYKGKDKVPIKIDEKCMDNIRDYATRESYRSRKFGKADGVEMRYKDSKFLFRSCKSGKLTPAQITAMTRYTNPYAEEVGKRFAFGKIYQSGTYYRVYLDEQENGELKKVFKGGHRLDEKVIERLARLFDYSEESLEKLSHRLELFSRKYVQYQEYKKVFYNK